MECAACREALSAAWDGEAAADEAVAAREHARTCPDCDRWSQAAGALHARLRIGVADPVPDLAGQIAAAVSSGARPRRTRRLALPPLSPPSRLGWLRITLGAVGAAQLLLAIAQLAGGQQHSGQEVGAWTVASAVGLLSAAMAPRRTAGMLPLMVVAAAAIAATAVRDIAVGHIHLWHEVPHALLICGVALLVLLHRATRDEPDGERTGRATPRTDPAGSAADRAA